MHKHANTNSPGLAAACSDFFSTGDLKRETKCKKRSKNLQGFRFMEMNRAAAESLAKGLERERAP